MSEFRDKHLRVDRFYHPAHYAIAQELLKARGMNENMVYDLPELGFIAFFFDHPVAIGFLREIEGKYGLIDGFISDPLQESTIRDKALDKITANLIDQAKERKILKIVAFVEDPNTIARSIKHGFARSTYQLMGLNLSKDEKLCRF